MKSIKFSKFSPLALLALLLLAGAFQGCEGASGRAVVHTATLGQPSPDFTLELFDGGKWELKEHRGKPVVISFMASWCPCSKDSIPIVKEAHELFAPKGVEFLLVGTQDKEGKFRDFVEEWEVPFPAGYDGDKFLAGTFGVRNPPTTVFIDKSGKVTKVFYGNIKEDVGRENYFAWIEEVL